MLFNSYLFILVFLPVTLGIYLLIIRQGWRKQSFDWLVLASLFFYGWWKWSNVPLLIGSLLFNYTIGTWLGKIPQGHRARVLLVVGLAGNLLFLGYFKYANFFIDNADALFGLGWGFNHVILPLGISFITFQKIAYLVDSYQGLTRGYGFRDFCLFVSFFPQLIAGPIVHHSELMPQFRRKDSGPNWEDFGVGVTLFVIGLGKKVLVADPFATFANPGLQRRAQRDCPGLRRRVDRHAGLHHADLLRFLGLHRHGDRAGPHVRHPAAVELQFALQGHEHRRVLAALAHDPVTLPARLPLHPAGRQPQGPGAPLRQPDDHHAAGRPLARRRLDVRRLGRLARALPLSFPRLARLARTHRAGAPDALSRWTMDWTGADLPAGHAGLGLLPCGELLCGDKGPRRHGRACMDYPWAPTA